MSTQNENETSTENESAWKKLAGWKKTTFVVAIVVGFALIGALGKKVDAAQNQIETAKNRKVATATAHPTPSCSWYAKYGKAFIVAECETLWKQPAYVDEVSEGRQTVTASGPALVAICSADPDVFSECAEWWIDEYKKHLAKPVQN